LQLKDLDSVDKKIDKLKKMSKGGDKEVLRGIDVLGVYKAHLESGQSARTAPVLEEDKRFIEDIQLLTAKPVIYCCNVEEASVNNGNKWVEEIRQAVAGENAEVVIVSAAIEADIAVLETEEERTMFLEELGLKESGLNRLIRAAYHLLDLQTYFTAGVKEVRAWTIHKGFKAPQAAGVIHSDFERGFIRAEVMAYDDFVNLKTEAACRAAGKLRSEGKEYVVNDGDIMHFLFNV
jgi:GTP-binding protein YchF